MSTERRFAVVAVTARGVRRTVPLLALAACQGASSTAPPTATGPAAAVSAAHAGLHSTLRILPEIVAPGATFSARYTIRNAAQDTARLVFECTSPAASFALRGEAQPARESLRHVGCFTAVVAAELPPGAERVVDVTWPAAREGASEQAGDPLPTGRYVVDAVPALLELNGQRVTLPTLSAGFTVR